MNMYIQMTGGLNLLKIVEIIREYFEVYICQYRPYEIEHFVMIIMPMQASITLVGKSKLINAPVMLD